MEKLLEIRDMLITQKSDRTQALSFVDTIPSNSYTYVFICIELSTWCMLNGKAREKGNGIDPEPAAFAPCHLCSKDVEGLNLSQLHVNGKCCKVCAHLHPPRPKISTDSEISSSRGVSLAWRTGWLYSGSELLWGKGGLFLVRNCSFGRK